MHNRRLSLGVIILAALVATGIAGGATAITSESTQATDEQSTQDGKVAVTSTCSGAETIFCDGFETGDMSAWAPRACDAPVVNLPVPTSGS